MQVGARLKPRPKSVPRVTGLKAGYSDSDRAFSAPFLNDFKRIRGMVSSIVARYYDVHRYPRELLQPLIN